MSVNMMRATDRLAQFARTDSQPSLLQTLRDAAYALAHARLLYVWSVSCLRMMADRHTTYFHQDFGARLLLPLLLVFPVMLALAAMGAPGRPAVVAVGSYLLFAVLATFGLQYDFSTITVGQTASHIARDGYVFAGLATTCLVGYVVYLVCFVARRR